MSNQRKLASYPLFYEQIPAQVPKVKKPVKRFPGRKPKHPQLPKDNVLENFER